MPSQNAVALELSFKSLLREKTLQKEPNPVNAGPQRTEALECQ